MARLGNEPFLARGSDLGEGVVERLRANRGERVLGAGLPAGSRALASVQEN